MMNRQAPFALALALGLGLLACASSSDDIQGDSSAVVDGDKDKKKQATASDDSARTKKNPTRTEATDGGGAPSPSGVGTLTLDGKACTVERAGLDTGLDGYGWMLQVSANCPTGLILNIAGVDNASYPQRDVFPFLAEEGASLILTRPGELETDTFLASSGGDLLIETGPTSNARASVKGTATVKNAGTTGTAGAPTHRVTFEFRY